MLRKRFPNVPNLGDITKVDWSPYHGTVDLVVGGSPCQSFSLAGKREGLAGASGLMYEYIRCIQGVMPEWLIWENVPGAFSSERGWAFEQLLSALDECGYGLAWRVLDAQFFGVAQRRRRVFLVGHAGDMRAAEVLFESESLRWDSPSSREKREAIAAAAGVCAGGAGECMTQFGEQLAGTLTNRADSSPTPMGGAEHGPVRRGLQRQCIGGGKRQPDTESRRRPDIHRARTATGADVFPCLNATDAGKGFSNNQAINSGALILDRTDTWA